MAPRNKSIWSYLLWSPVILVINFLLSGKLWVINVEDHVAHCRMAREVIVNNTPYSGRLVCWQKRQFGVLAWSLTFLATLTDLTLLYIGLRVGPTVELCILTQFSYFSCRSEPNFLNRTFLYYNCGCPLYGGVSGGVFVRPFTTRALVYIVRVFHREWAVFHVLGVVINISCRRSNEKQIRGLWRDIAESLVVLYRGRGSQNWWEGAVDWKMYIWKCGGWKRKKRSV